MDISIVIPALNEEKRIERTLFHYLEFFEKKKKSFEIIVVLNGCTDNTLDIVKKITKKYSQLKYEDLSQRGKGRALVKGLGIAKGNLISYVDL